MLSRMQQHCRRLALFFLALLLAFTVSRGYAQEAGKKGPSEYQLKAAFVNNFIKFVDWPLGERSIGESFRVCLLGAEPLAEPFEELNGQEALGHSVTVTALQSPQEARSCQVLFVAASQSARLTEVIDGLAGAPVLTIGDTDGFARRGIMINMFLDNKRIRFEINAEAARSAGLRVSTKLLKLSSKVYGAVPRGE
jgi:YfiR/HmsC-like